MKKSILHIKGFTIIELLVVIAIIALLTGIVMTSLSPAKAKARDAKRISDVGQMQLALELFFDRCKEYPSALDPDEECSNPDIPVILSDYISVIPTTLDETTSGYTPTGSPKRNDYKLFTKLENYNVILKDDIDHSDCGTDGTGNDELVYCLGPK